jgi:tetratricopeptide (TPR) repeat protein
MTWCRFAALAGAAASLPIGLLAATSPQTARRAPTAAEIGGVLSAYASGDDRTVERWIHGFRFYLHNNREFEAAVEASAVSPRIRAAFAAEVLAASRDRSAVARLMRAGREWLLDGAKPLGVDAESDRFEILWHQIALAAAQRLETHSAQHSHLEAIRPRFAAARRRGVEPASRLPLARAIAAVGSCCPESLPGMSVHGLPIINAPVKTTGSAEGALLLFKAAAAVPALEVEALIRAGVLLYGVGRERAALEWLERVPPHEDATLGYVQHLTRGHVYDALDRSSEAADAYARARDYMPTAQSAAIGEAAALLRAGRADDAARVAAAARTSMHVSAAVDPRQVFRAGDARFIPEWLAEIRRMRR